MCVVMETTRQVSDADRTVTVSTGSTCQSTLHVDNLKVTGQGSNADNDSMKVEDIPTSRGADADQGNSQTTASSHDISVVCRNIGGIARYLRNPG